MKKLIPILLIFVCLLVGCAHDNPVRRISAQEAHDMMKELDEFVLIDARSYNEFIQRRIDGAISIPYDEIAVRAADEIPDKDTVILVYCQAGRRSAIAARTLADLGYINIYDFGGLNDWPFETVSD